jgi:PST family polysaccharide transporter
VWSTVAFVGTKASTLLTTIVLARVLVPDDFGLVAAVVAYVAVVEMLSDLGLRATVVYEQGTGVSDRVQSAFTANLVVAAGLTVLGVALAPLVASAFGMADEAWLFRLAALNPLLTGLGNVHDGLLLRDMAFRRRLRPQLARAVVRGVASVALALAGAGAASLVLGMLVGTAAWSAVLWTMAPFRPTLRLTRAHVASMAGYSSGAMALEVVAVIGVRADTLVVAQALGAGALGLYAVAYRLPELVIENVAWSISDVAFPALARQRRADPAGLAAATLAILRGSALYAGPMGAGLAVLGVPLVVVLFSERWRDAGEVLSAIAVLCVFVAIAFPLGDVFKALGRQRTLVALNLVGIPLTVVLMLAATPWGIVGVALARAAAGALNCVVLVVLVVHAVGIPARALATALGPAAAATAGVLVGTLAVRALVPDDALLPLATATLAGAVGAVAAVVVLAPRTTDELLALARRVRPPGAPRRRPPGGTPRRPPAPLRSTTEKEATP